MLQPPNQQPNGPSHRNIPLITGRDMELLYQALIQSFPQEMLLKQFLRFRMDLDLEGIAKPGSLSTRVLEVIQYLDTQGLIRKLVVEAPRFNPRNTLLAQVCQGIQKRIFDVSLQEHQFDDQSVAYVSGQESQFVTDTMAQRAKTFIYYSKEDSAWVDKLCSHLRPLIDKGLISLWDDRNILPLWHLTIEQAMSHANVAVLIISADFLASSFFKDIGLPELLSEKESLKVFWIAVRPSLVAKTTITQFQALNNPEIPLCSMSKALQEVKLVTIADQIYKVIEN